jgi:hypothetical protein
MRVSYGARWLPRSRMRGNRRSVGSKCPAGHRQTPSAGFVDRVRLSISERDDAELLRLLDEMDENPTDAEGN